MRSAKVLSGLFSCPESHFVRDVTSPSARRSMRGRMPSARAWRGVAWRGLAWLGVALLLKRGVSPRGRSCKEYCLAECARRLSKNEKKAE